MLVDTHCHLSFPQFDPDRDDILDRAGDMIIVDSQVNPSQYCRSLELSAKYPRVFSTLGFGAGDLDGKSFELAKNLVRENQEKIVGLGEVGLDYYWVKDEAGRAVEKEHFTQMLELAGELDLPVIIHSRDAEGDVINILKEANQKAIMHCFSGSVEQAGEAADMGCLISIPTNIAYNKSRQKMAKSLPLESMVLETDAPYLSPVLKTRNEPANIRVSAEKIAEIKGIQFEAVAQATTENAMRFLRIRW
jgi:TatD DNase family protein